MIRAIVLGEFGPPERLMPAESASDAHAAIESRATLGKTLLVVR